MTYVSNHTSDIEARAHRSLPAAWMISNMDAYSIKLTVIAALLLSLMYLFCDLMLHPLPA